MTELPFLPQSIKSINGCKPFIDLKRMSKNSPKSKMLSKIQITQSIPGSPRFFAKQTASNPFNISPEKRNLGVSNVRKALCIVARESKLSESMLNCSNFKTEASVETPKFNHLQSVQVTFDKNLSDTEENLSSMDSTPDMKSRCIRFPTIPYAKAPAKDKQRKNSFSSSQDISKENMGFTFSDRWVHLDSKKDSSEQETSQLATTKIPSIRIKSMNIKRMNHTASLDISLNNDKITSDDRDSRIQVIKRSRGIKYKSTGIKTREYFENYNIVFKSTLKPESSVIKQNSREQAPVQKDKFFSLLSSISPKNMVSNMLNSKQFCSLSKPNAEEANILPVKSFFLKRK